MISLVFAGCLLLPGLLRAEFYRYVGEDGAIHFTDDLSKVPKDQRDKMEAYTGVQSPSPRRRKGPMSTRPPKRPSGPRRRWPIWRRNESLS